MIFPFWLLIICFVYFTFNARCENLLTEFRNFNLKATRNPVELKNYENFIEALKIRNKDAPAHYPFRNYAAEQVRKICVNVGKFLNAKLKYAGGRNDCIFALPIDAEISVRNTEHAGFLHHFANDSRLSQIHPLRVLYRDRSRGTLIHDLILYDTQRDIVHFANGFGLMFHLKELSRNLNEFPKSKNELTSYLNEKNERDENSASSLHETTIPFHLCISLYFGGIYTSHKFDHRHGPSVNYLFPATGLSVDVDYYTVPTDLSQRQKYYFERDNGKVVKVISVGKIIVGNEKAINGFYPNDMFYYEVKYGTFGIIQDFDYSSHVLKKALRK